MPAVTTVTLTGGTWLTADQGSALFDGKPGRASRIRRTGELAITITLADAVAPAIIAILGLNIPPGVQVSAVGTSGTTVRLPDGSVCAWLFPQSAALVSTVSVEIATTATNVDVGEIAIFRAVDVGISDGWAVATIDASTHTRTKGGQVNTVPGRLYRRLTCTLSGRSTPVVRGNGLGGMDWETIGAALAGRRRSCVVPQFRDMLTKAFDPLLAARSALYGFPIQLPSAENISRQYFSGYMEFEEIPA
ncbi:TPA: hypothetical protein ACOEOC_000466 [Stenotrophomonas maltophilia]|uniref:Uncharacterized protein n=2 Tax=Stenotrophomonas maltophilia TaxID=40324 RepID=A0AAI9CJD4_STEMA|nr:hypothetical protein [Stenotrophomonas maltophilia]EKZ1926190.1 hypothetical protein [Stenotrophomonas maltophilia]EMB2743924.1 hypothetical protein [Stenotrophomonas maltophilia]MBH1418358.1 hypothetical protein [Stenotrophomonas maltophilia]MBH1685560.1 hypothetical protein [Stenotrophomonas maltophilia]MBH1812792.1 hypothetical protein [Stenotrophomonas maltophilia]